MRQVMLCLILSAAVSATAADLTIGVGESETLSGVQAFDRIFCNGSLTIAEGAEISCTSFCMASGVVENVSVTLQNGSTLSMPPETGGCLIGCDGGAGVLTLGTNAIFKTTKRVSVQLTTKDGDAFFTEENPFPETARIFIHLMDGASMVGPTMDSVIAFGDWGKVLSYGSYGRFEGITVLLDKDAYLDYSSFQHRSRPNCRILFNGGYLRQGQWNTSRTATLFSNIGWYESTIAGARFYLTGTNRNDIVIQRDSYANAVFHLSSGGGKFTLDGDGGFVIRGTYGRHPDGSVTKLVNEDTGPTKDWIDMKFPGRISIGGRIWVQLCAYSYKYKDESGNEKTVKPGKPRSDFFPEGSTLEIGPNAVLDLQAADITNVTVVCQGSIVNAAVESIANGGNVISTVLIGGESDARIESLGTNIVVRKSGTGCLTLGTNLVDVAGVAALEGALAIDGRDEGNPAACIRELTLGAGVACATTESAKGRRIAVQRLEMESTANAEIDTFAPVAEGAFSLMNYEGGLDKTPVRLPFKVGKTADRKNFKSWSLYVNGELRGAVGSANPAIGIYDGWLTLGNFGTRIVFK
mgnify:FL=1